ncbi:MAG: glycoside hydrolase family 95 protein [Ferruginibacter sp.]
MIKGFFFGVLLLVAQRPFCQVTALQTDPDKILWYNHPAGSWTEALPLGNGYLGAMVFGGTATERLQLNENTLYSGEPQSTFTNIDVRRDFPAVYELMKKKKYAEAQQAVVKNWLGRNHQSYQPLGDLWIKMKHDSAIKDYKRRLDIDQAVSTISYNVNNTAYTREYFASYPAHIIVIRLTAKGRDKLNATIQLTTPHTPGLHYQHLGQSLTLTSQAPGFVVRRTLNDIENIKDTYKYPEVFDKDGLRLSFAKQVLYGAEVNNRGMYFTAAVQPLSTDGTVKYENDQLVISNATEAVLIYTAATSFNGFDKSPSLEGKKPLELTRETLTAAARSDYTALFQQHIKDYQTLFNRVNINLGVPNRQSTLPTDERIALYNNDKDPSLVNLFFQYGRYLMIAGSRPGGQPLNLQGIWNDKIIPPWNSGYTMNINVQMNYWPAEITNLAECQQPFFEAIHELAVNGSVTANKMYGMDGWVAHHNSDIWRHTEPVDFCKCAFWPMGAGWLVSHLWEHYLFSGDTAYLRKDIYPLLKGAAAFYNDWLVKNENGNWITPVGHSPEQSFVYEGKEIATLSPGPTMDMAIVRETFSRLKEAADLLKINDAVVKAVKEKIPQLLPYQIGKYGQLQEWAYDFEDEDVHHRHVSHLYGLYPGNQINPWDNPQLSAAVNKVLERRGDKATGWAMGWRINLQARLLNAAKAYTQLKNLLVLVKDDETKMQGGGTYPNLFDAHPPFQIDGNFGATAGIAEMLLQSHAGAIVLLPALPEQWPNGNVSGLKARGGFTVNMKWEKQKLKSVEIISALGGNCRLRLPDKIKTASAVFKMSEGINSNPLFSYISPGSFKGVENSYMALKRSDFKNTYDITTFPGQVITFNCE